MAKIVIVGNSAAGFSACQTLIEHGQNDIVIISQEIYPTYKRNQLINFLADNISEQDMFLCQEDFYKKNNINFLNKNEAIKLDTRKQKVILKDNQKVSYEFLVIATGQNIELPNLPGKTKYGIFTFYTLEDAKQIKEKLVISKTICIVGIARICLNLAEIFQTKDKEVKIISKEDFAPLILSEKVELIQDLEPKEFIGEGQLQALKLSNGKIIGTTLVIFVGLYTPATDFLKETEIKTEQDFILVNETMRTNLENIFACGSVCKSENYFTKEKLWEDATKEGSLAAFQILKLIKS